MNVKRAGRGIFSRPYISEILRRRISFGIEERGIESVNSPIIFVKTRYNTHLVTYTSCVTVAMDVPTFSSQRQYENKNSVQTLAEEPL
jgi:hypothetical protein